MVRVHVGRPKKAFLLKYILFVLLLFLPLYADVIKYKITPNNSLHVNNQKIKILDSKFLYFKNKNDVPFHEISDLAYKNNILYFVSDEGYLYKFFLLIKNQKINILQYLNAYTLKNKKMHKLKKKKSDSEGLAFYKDALLISFERKHRISLYSKKAVKIKKVKIHHDLQNKNNYVSKNKGLEAVSFNAKYGVITAPELPLKNQDNQYHILYTCKKVFKFMADGNIVGLEFMNKDDILVLLREFNYITRRRVTSLVQVGLNHCNKKRICQSRVLAKLDSNDGWHLDNFEGLTKVDKNQYLIVSDDNDNFLQKTLLVLFEIKD